MEQTSFEVKKNGKYIKADELYEMAKEEIVDILDNMDYDDALYLGNAVRDNKGYDTLYENNRENINDQLDCEEPYDILNLDWDYSSEFFTWDGCSIDMTDDVWADLDTDDIAIDLLDGSYTRYLNDDLREVINDYEEAKEFLETLNPYREEAREVIRKYVNCEADVTDLLQCLDKLVRNDAAWAEEE